MRREILSGPVVGTEYKKGDKCQLVIEVLPVMNRIRSNTKYGFLLYTVGDSDRQTWLIAFFSLPV